MNSFKILMTEGTIVDFYPEEFEQDMNGKKSDWEAVVKVPFIDEKRLIAAMKTKESLLTELNKKINTHGDSFIFKSTPLNALPYPSSLPDHFPALPNNTCTESIYQLPQKSSRGFLNDLCLNARTHKKLLTGFPTLSQIPHRATIAHGSVTIFQQASQNESVILHIDASHDLDFYCALLGKSIHTGYPYTCESILITVRDDIFSYTLHDNTITREEHTPRTADQFQTKSESLAKELSKHGIDSGVVDIILTVRTFSRILSQSMMII